MRIARKYRFAYSHRWTLVESLDANELGDNDRLWLTEAKRRRDEVRSGGVESIPGDEALEKVRNLVRR